MNSPSYKRRSIWIGYEPREAGGFAVTKSSIERNVKSQIPIRAVILDDLRTQSLYTRPTSRKDGRLWDDISEAPMSTEFAISRFLVPALANDGWALFVDSDVLVRKNLDRLFHQADPSKAVMVVKHDFQPPEGVKMDGQAQQRYARKNWSSVCLFNCDHPATKALTISQVNSLPGRDLHRFCWLQDDLIGELDVKWNWLVGHSDPAVDPAIVHFTEGLPTIPGYENCAYADEWQRELRLWAA